MKTKLIFEVDSNDENSPYDKDHLKKMMNVDAYVSVLFDFDQYLRTILKYGDEGLSDETVTKLQEARDKLWELCREEGISATDE